MTDGEFRRTSFREVPFESIDGFGKERVDTDRGFARNGFACLYGYGRMGLDVQKRKLDLLVATAREIWG